MTKKQREKVVAIAKDVLKQIPKLTVAQGTYINFDNDVAQSDVEGQELQALLPKLMKGKACKVCALGACMISHVRLFDKFKIPEAGYAGDSIALSDGDFRDDLVASFGERNLSLIECAFEMDDYHGDADLDDKEVAVTWGEQYDKSDDRLRAIMKNIIANNGEFLPESIRKVRKGA